jgi:SAM-dependent methyltransferase
MYHHHRTHKQTTKYAISIFVKLKQFGFTGCVLRLIKKIYNHFQNGVKRIKHYNKIKIYFKNKNGLEIGGPSDIFREKNYIPVYDKMNLLDGVNYSNSTIWTGSVDSTKGFVIDGNSVGKLYIADAIDLSIVSNDAYDFILSSNNIEHIANPMKAIEQCLLKLRNNGILVIIAPRKESNFDHRRSIVKFEHLLEDYRNNTAEDDLTHLAEILSLHDLSMDTPAGTFEQFKTRSLNNFENRCLHQHCFDLDVLTQIYNYFDLKIVQKIKRKK